jgi:hypothetical protein
MTAAGDGSRQHGPVSGPVAPGLGDGTRRATAASASPLAGKPDSGRLAAIGARLGEASDDTKWLAEQFKQLWADLDASAPPEVSGTPAPSPALSGTSLVPGKRDEAPAAAPAPLTPVDLPGGDE